MSDEVPYKDFDEDGIDPWLALAASQDALQDAVSSRDRYRAIVETVGRYFDEGRPIDLYQNMEFVLRLRQALSPNPSETGAE